MTEQLVCEDMGIVFAYDGILHLHQKRFLDQESERLRTEMRVLLGHDDPLTLYDRLQYVSDN